MFFFFSQGTISETTGLILHSLNLTILLIFPTALILSVTSITPGMTFNLYM